MALEIFIIWILLLLLWARSCVCGLLPFGYTFMYIWRYKERERECDAALLRRNGIQFFGLKKHSTEFILSVCACMPLCTEKKFSTSYEYWRLVNWRAEWESNRSRMRGWSANSREHTQKYQQPAKNIRKLPNEWASENSYTQQNIRKIFRS